ncbi:MULTISPECIES: bifunctional DNA primase/polymerase [unclassified Nocardiopsis]|uniref:bifunctional DNA primase/polymerase n=1 Tax=unclassified Nocardiopsis TaxID=2649073 RepID=UPI0009395793|nr:bifunctional DNA primase/polymerase [Nocardiopsis sp. TSRI0078]
MDAAQQYIDAGWQVVGISGKKPARKGFTGRTDNTTPDIPRKGENVALRLPKGVLALDVDAYDGKVGGDTLARLERKLGPLPATDRSGSRDGISGIYLFSVPEDYEAVGELPGIETVQWFHRTVVCEPSIHEKTGATYRWHPVGDSPMWLNGPESLPKLPDAWLEHLRKDRVNVAQKRTEGCEGGFLTDGAPCDAVTAVLDRYNNRVENGESRYGSMITGQYNLMKLGEAGHPGVATVMDTLESLYLAHVEGERDAQGEWNRGLNGLYLIADLPLADGDPCEDNNLNLPDSFWESRKSLKHIRQAAHSRVASADAVLYTTLARMAAMVDHRTRIETGIKSPASLNLFVAVVGKSGAGKSSSVSVGKKLMPAPVDLEGFRDGLPIGSGEGFSAAYWGTVWEEDPTNLKKDGSPVKVRVTKQVRHNVFFTLDEGRALNKMVERSGTTINPTLCSAFIGDLIGQSNASVDTTRIVPDGSYSAGFVVGYQYDAAGVLLSEEDSGLPQRFLWVNATDPSIPDERTGHPGELKGYKLRGEWTSVDGTHFEPVMALPEDLQEMLYKRFTGIAKGKIDPPAELDSHAPLIRAKISALLCLLDGRTTVTHEDWELSGVMWETSCAVRSNVLERNAEAQAEREEMATRKAVERERRLQLARNRAEPNLKKAAEAIARQVHKSGRFTPGKLKNALNSGHREVFDEALEYASDEGWIISDDGAFFPGPEKP